jgi:hypothetical protein
MPFTAALPLIVAPGVPDQPLPPPPASNGFFALEGFLTYNAATAIDAQGGVHMAFYTSDERQAEPRGTPAYYLYCPAGALGCADPSKWSTLVQMDSSVNEVQIVVTPDGRPRLLVRRSGERYTYDYDYWACEQQCTNAENWAGLRVNDAQGVELNNADLPQHSFALDSQGRPRYVYPNGWGNGRPSGIYYNFCDAADCTEPGSWQSLVISEPNPNKTVSSDYASLVFDGVRPRVLTRLNLSGLPVSLNYYWCDQFCDEQGGWGTAAISHPEGKMWANWDLALDAAGQPHIALYEPAAIDITVGGKLFYAWCDSGCDEGDDFHPTQVASGEGRNVDIAIDPQGRVHMVYDAGQRGTIGEVWCDAGCANPGAWQRRILETNDRLMQEFAPPSPLTCDQQLRMWLDAVPTVSFDAQGRMVVAYDVKNVARCYYSDPTDPGNGGSRVERVWWAIRWTVFERA